MVSNGFLAGLGYLKETNVKKMKTYIRALPSIENGPVHRRPTFSNMHMMPKATRTVSLAPYAAFATNFAVWAPHGHMKKSDISIVS